MKKLLAALAALSVLAAPAWAADGLLYTKVSASQVVTNTTLPSLTQEVLLINDGANEVYFDLYGNKATPADATTSSKEIKPGESLTFHFEGQESGTTGNTYYKTLSVICAAGETATVRVISK